jgi:prolyl oligopeptidase PreP (S9A serine peptidase family)
MVDYTETTCILEGTNRVKHLSITYTTESGSKISLFNDEVAEVTWSDGNGVVRVEGKTPQAAAASGLNLLEMLTGAGKAREQAETVEAEPEAEKVVAVTKPVKKAASKTVVIEQPVE